MSHPLGAVLHAPRDVRTEPLEQPPVGPTDVLLDVEACGVCGSDLASYAHGHYVEPGQVMGHELSATVAVAGAALGLEPGTRVAVRPMRSCGECAYCHDGDTHLCGSTAGRSLGYGAQGAFAEQLHLPDVVVGRDVVPVPAATDPFDLLWAEPLAVALHAVGLAAVNAGGHVLVTGAGAVGLTVTAAALARDLTVHVVEPVEHRRDAAARLGATTSAPGEPTGAASYDALLDASGVPAAVTAALPLLAPAAPVVLVGLNDAAVPWPVGAHRVTGSFGYVDTDFAAAVDLIVSRRVSLAELVTHRYPLDQADRALDAPRPEDHVVKAAIVPRA
ncbi:zinc-dependent alcohol dehydrogenase [Nocardioides deserti]|uniref:Alcohol dehydrogenase catalytic domain-containing protein n=1 Tax=Nocardioides deserti TaxID=1588644 RepID=A0ABR6U9D7_9ACTN|nr:alcohol dehydrogenase catalytic domain-containing protein [Nocardioides deserti]MBC2960416.1 alcohol dehydrogenase catalytic domain-containing protein [Nocardioides deserti]GGO71451.1 sorbitol dehydrogenase [Nocardioides deserti]